MKRKGGLKKQRVKRPNKGWGQVYQFVKAPKLEPPKESVYGAVYYAMRSLKKGTIEEVVAEAGKHGLHKVTKQNPYIQTQIKLRRLRRLGCVTMMSAKALRKADEKKKGSGKKAPPKKTAVKKAAPKPKATAKAKAAPPKKETDMHATDEELRELETIEDESEDE